MPASMTKQRLVKFSQVIKNISIRGNFIYQIKQLEVVKEVTLNTG
jgi:hypothetical protein